MYGSFDDMYVCGLLFVYGLFDDMYVCGLLFVYGLFDEVMKHYAWCMCVCGLLE